MKKLLGLVLAASFSTVATAATVEERLEALEFNSYEDIFRFDGQLDLMYSTQTSDNKDTDTQATQQDWRYWAKLNFTSKPSDKMQVYGRFSTAKHLNRMSQYTDGDFGDADGQLDEGQTMKNSDVYLERLFVNYSFSPKTTFTFGRLPTANGTPDHLTRDEANGGGYPHLVYNAFFDGWALSHRVTSDLSVKFIHTPFMSTSSNETAGGEEVERVTDLYSIMLEYEKTGYSWARRFHMVLQHLSANNIVLGLNRPIFESTTKTLSSGDKRADLNYNIQRTTLALEASGLFGSKFDVSYQVMSLTHSTNDALIVDVTSSGTKVAESKYYWASKDGKEQNSLAHLLTTRYTINDTNKVGFQYAKNDQNIQISDIVYRTPISMIEPGSAYHLFYNHNFGGGLKATVGYMESQIDYTGSLSGAIGEMVDADIKNQAVYTNFTANF